MKYLYVLFFALFFLSDAIHGQTRPSVGLRSNTPNVVALTNARIVTSPGNIINNGTLVIRDGIIESAGSGIQPPADAWVTDMKGKSIYPGFIDMWAEIGLSGQDAPDGAVHWNPQVRAWFDAASNFTYKEDEVKKLRSQGFVIANVVSSEGIFRGRSALVSLAESDINRHVIRSGVSQVMSLERSRDLGTGYPTSRMGSIALIRQTFYDADWYERARSAYSDNPGGQVRPETNIALESLLDAGNGRQPVLFEVGDEIDFMRAGSIASEFGLDLWIKGSGHEYRRLQSIKDAGVPVILPLNFPAVPDIESPEKAMNISLQDLRHWDFAPENPAMLADAGVTIAFTASGTGNSPTFYDQVKIAVERGMARGDALAALTTTPARILGIDNKYGSVNKGMAASFIVTSSNLFNPDTKIEEVWIDGIRYEKDKPADSCPRGKWAVRSDELGDPVIDISGTESRLRGAIERNNKKAALRSVKFDNHRISILFQGDSIGLDGIIRLSASFSQDELYGIGEMADGSFINWKADRIESFSEPAGEPGKPSLMSEGRMLYPSMEYGLEEMPQMPGNVIVRNATIWTQGPSGKIENADMLVSGGRIVEVGTNLRAPRNAVVIDATGKHVTPGLIDPHIHSSIRGGVNEVGNNMTPETRVIDVLEPDNIWIYRLLAGGLTTANLLHGSANPVGGQDAVIKMRWGGLPEEMILQGARPGLKLALGENVVRNPAQYPNTRMGAEQIIRDAFQAAKDYAVRWESWESDRKGLPPRKDLQMEALLEVLRGERIVHAHAYRQDEMLMLMRLAEELDFHITSFEHTLEGYKIADKLREHGAAAVIWTDWSSFKVEAADGILYNAKLLMDGGVLTSLHSDNTQLATRMNWEAGKLLPTGIDEIEAMNLITINAAKIIGADHLIGSLEQGKHADFVIWNGHPLSGFTHAEQTWVDGRKYFDRNEDMKKRIKVREERGALIQKASRKNVSGGQNNAARAASSGR